MIPFRTVPLEGSPERIAIFRALYLGDLLCSVPALRALRHRFPDAEITFIGLPWAEGFTRRFSAYIDRFLEFPGYPGIREMEVVPERLERFLDQQRAYNFDLALQMHGDGRVSNGFVADLGARLSLGYRHGADDRLTVTLSYDPQEHEILRWLRLTSLLGARSDNTRTEFPTTRAEEERAIALVSGGRRPPGPLIGLHVGAKDPVRRWPTERFAALADELADHYGARLVLTGSAGEQAMTASVRRAVRAPVLDLAGETDLGTFVAVLARLDLLVTNDTGASHIAAARRTPSVILFGPTRPEQWAPLDRERHRVVDALTLAGPGADPAAALRELPVEPVLGACAAVLGRSRLAVVRDRVNEMQL